VFSYAAYGLNIDSALTLPELVSSEKGRADLAVRFGKVERVRPEAPRAGCIRATTREAYLFWEEAGAFLVRGGREIIIDPAPGVDERVLRLVVLGPAFGALL
jgi:hypothetical protein